MAKVIFYPEKRKNELGVLRLRNVPLLLFFSFEGKRLQYYTGESIDLKDWDFKSRRVNHSHPEHISINEHLDFLKRRVMEVYRDLKLSGGEVNLPSVRKKLKESLRKSRTSFFDLLVLFIEEKNREWTLSTYRKIKTFYNHMRNFHRKTGIEPELASMDDKFFHALTDYFRNDCQHIDSTIRKNMEVFMWFMNWALKKGFHGNYEFRKYIDKYLNLNNSSKDEFVLGPGELNSLLNCPVSGKKEMLARDVFVFACYTGLSCMEIRMLRPGNIEEDWIKITSGSRTRSVPLVLEARKIISAYLKSEAATLFPKIYPGKINRYLKEIARKTSLNREVIVKKYINGKETDATNPAYRLLTFSVARKTFVHLSLTLGISPFFVAQTAGYKSMNSLDLHSAKTDKQRLNEFKKFDI